MQDQGLQTCSRFLGKISGLLTALPESEQRQIREIRIRRGRPLALDIGGQIYFVLETGGVTPLFRQGTYLVTDSDMDGCFQAICGYSAQSHIEDIRQGFITLPGGHRAGLCGTAAMDPVHPERIVSVRDISSINLRVARQIDGAADSVLSAFSDGLCSLLIAGPPGSGKTTILKDLARRLSGGQLGRCIRVAAVDPRGEIGAVFHGVPQNDLGPCTDVLDGYPKGIGMELALRTLSPEVILCDEIGSAEEAEAVRACMHGGAAVIATAHAGSLAELIARPVFSSLVGTGGFHKAAVLVGAGLPCRIACLQSAGNRGRKAV